MKKFKFISIAFISFGMLLTSCKKDEPSIISNVNLASGTEQAVGTLNLGNTVSADFMGQVIDENKNPIQGATIKCGSLTATSDQNGFFVLNKAMVHEDLAYIKAEKAGFFPGSRSLIPSTTGANQVQIMMLALDVVGTVSSGNAQSVSTVDGATVDFNGDFKDAAGNPYSGTVNVAMKSLPALDPETPLQMPGMLYAENSSGESGALVTFGMLGVELFGSNGESLQIADGSSATIHVPVDQAQLNDAPASIPLWHFDEVAGYWVEEGSAELINGEYVGIVSHFSFWNCDDFYEDCQFSGHCEDQNGYSLSGAHIAIETQSGSTTAGIADSNGDFHTYLPANQTIEMVVTGGCQSNQATFNFGPYGINTSNSETLVLDNSGLYSFEVIGMVNDCSGNPITSGYVKIVAGTQTKFAFLNNGVFSKEIIECVPISDLTVQGYSVGAGLSSDALTYTVNQPITDVGTFDLCNNQSGGGTGSGNFIMYQVDSDPYVLLEDDIIFMYSDSLTNVGFSIGTPFEPDLYIGSDSVNTTGVYNATNLNETNTVFTFHLGFMNFMAPFDLTTEIDTYEGPGGIIHFTTIGTFEGNDALQHTLVMEVQCEIPN